MKLCIVCGEYSNGKPQCRNCYKQSIAFIEEDLDDDNYTDEKYNSIYNLLIAQALNAKHIKEKFVLCNKIIGLGILANDYETDLNNTELKLYKSYYDARLIIDNKYTDTIESEEFTLDSDSADYRKRFPCNIRCQDGHYVRSQEERTIDDYLYQKGLVHSYEEKFRLNANEQSYCKRYKKSYTCFFPDFYIPQLNLYLEYFGRNDKTYNQKTDLKVKIFQDRKDINFSSLTYEDNNILLEKLEDILSFYADTDEITAF